MVHTSSKTRVQWRSCSNKHLAYVFQKCWPWTITEKSPTRKDWDRAVFDIPMFDKVVRTRDSRQNALLHVFASGKHFTHDVIHKYDKTVDPVCPFCTCLDSKHHRLFHCTAFKEIRKKHKKAIQWAAKQSNDLKFFGLPAIQPTLWERIQILCPPSPKWKLPPEDLEPWFLFLDGSAYGQTRRDVTISSWAVVRAQFMEHKFTKISSGFTPSWEHSSFRAEVAAILEALQLRKFCHLFSDCQSAVDTVKEFLTLQRNGDSFPCVNHSDLWFPIWELLAQRPHDAVTITKVDAHRDTASITDPVLKWYAAGNNYTDLQAKAVVLNHPIYRQFVKLEKDFATKSTLVSQYHDFICEMTEETYKLKPQRKPQVKDAGFVLPNFEQWGPENGFQFLLPPFDELPNGCPFGQTFYDRVREWFGLLRWPKSTVGVKPTPHIGLLEMYFDFVLTTRSESPINIGKRPVSIWRLLDEHPVLQQSETPLAKHTYSWTCFWKWCVKHSGVTLPFDFMERTTLNHVGYTAMSTCVTCRPRLACSASSLAAWKFFHQPDGRRRGLNFPLRPLPQP